MQRVMHLHSLNSCGILSGNQLKPASGERIIYMSSLSIIYWRLAGYNCQQRDFLQGPNLSEWIPRNRLPDRLGGAS